MTRPSLLVAGGGTGGHVLAGIAVADRWREKVGPDATVLFVGARGGIEEKLVPRAHYPLRLLALGSLKGVSAARKLRTSLQLPLAMARSAALLLRERPDAVLGVGGYASGPVVLVARLLRVVLFSGGFGARIAILEQNSTPGFTNRMLGRFVDRVCCAFPGMERRFTARKVLLTGNPVRSSIRPLPPAPRDPFTVFIFGGSQGAAGINTLVLDSLPELGDKLKRVRFIHQTGERDFERVQEGHRQAGSVARVEKFIHDMPAAYADASLVICRSGSSTLAELAAVGRAAVLVPFPFASDNHQEANARVFTDAGAAVLLVQKSSTGKDLAEIVRSLMSEPARLDVMESRIREFYRPNAAQDVVRALLDPMLK